jgi:flagellar L-ring protein precursor FlgH
MPRTRTLTTIALAGALISTAAAQDAAPSGSLMLPPGGADAPAATSGRVDDSGNHALRGVSMFAVAPDKPRQFKKHDLVQIIVRETSKAESTHELELEKDYSVDGRVRAWPRLRLEDIIQLQLYAGRDDNLPEVRVDLTKDFEGEGDYTREDDLTARLTAEVIEILPNGNLILEARTHIKTDEEESTINVTGVCRPEDVTASNSVLSNLIHDLKIEKVHKGELKKTNQKGILSKILDVFFAF